MSDRSALPEQFRSRFIEMYGEAELGRYEACLQEPPERGLRVNTLRMSASEFKKISSWELEPIPWCENGFYFEKGSDHTDTAAEDADSGSVLLPSRHPMYHAGVSYLQEPSAMLPAAILPVRPGDRVLDLCAAPGGKSTALAEKLRGEGLLVSNDISVSRAKALVHNLELFGAENVVVTTETPERLAEHFPDFFDKILVDAPCSGEGMFRKSEEMIRDWSLEKTRECASLQRKIAEAAIRMLRPGGMLVYSTCTYSPEEDEGTAAYLLSLPEAKEKGLRPEPIPMYSGFLPGKKPVVESVHLYPHRLRGEGHFAALFSTRMPETDETQTDRTDEMSGEGKTFSVCAYDEKKYRRNLEQLKKRLPDFADFAAGMRKDIDPDCLKLTEGFLTCRPLGRQFDRMFAGLRVMRSGLFLGEVKKNRFEPSQALAMTLSPDTFPNSLSLSMDDPRIQRYLRGETLEAEPGSVRDGWVLVTIDGLPLGFGKAKNGSIKNKLLASWRI